MAMVTAARMAAERVALRLQRAAPVRPSRRSMATGIVSATAARQEARRPELAEGDGRGEAGGRRRAGGAGGLTVTSRHARTGEAPRVAAASCRRGSMPRSTGRTVRTTKGTATSAWPTGTSHHDARQSTGATSNVISMPKPIVTAEVAIGSISPASSSRPCRRAAVIARAASAPTATASRGRHDGRAQATSPSRRRVDADADAGPDLGPAEVAPRRQGVTAAGAQRALEEGDAAARRRRRPSSRRQRATSHRWRPGRGRLRRASGLQRQRPAVTALLAAPPRPRRRRRRAAGGRRAWRRCRCRRAASPAARSRPRCVVVPTSPRTRITPKDVNVKTKMIEPAARIAGRSSGRVTSRNARHGEAPSVAAAASRSAGRCVPHRADGADDDGEVEQDVGERGSAGTPRSTPAGSRASTAAPMTTVGQDERRRPAGVDSSRRPGNAVAGDEYAGARPATIVSTVLTTACHSVNQAISHVVARPSVSTTSPGSDPGQQRHERPDVEHPEEAAGTAPRASASRVFAPRRVRGAGRPASRTAWPQTLDWISAGRCRSTGRSTPRGWR